MFALKIKYGMQKGCGDRQRERKREERESGRERLRYEEEKVLVINGKVEFEEVKFVRLYLDLKQF